MIAVAKCTAPSRLYAFEFLNHLFYNIIGFGKRALPAAVVVVACNPREKPVFESIDAAILLIYVHIARRLCRVFLSRWRIRGKFRRGVGGTINADLGCDMALVARRPHCCAAWPNRAFRRHHTLPLAQEAVKPGAVSVLIMLKDLRWTRTA